jgi:hypothetical protein
MKQRELAFLVVCESVTTFWGGHAFGQFRETLSLHEIGQPI